MEHVCKHTHKKKKMWKKNEKEKFSLKDTILKTKQVKNGREIFSSCYHLSGKTVPSPEHRKNVDNLQKWLLN